MATTLGKFKNAMSKVIVNFSGQTNGADSISEIEKYLQYSRPKFLNLTEDEVKASADHCLRPILVPRETGQSPPNVCFGYAECINAGKSELNEDQAHVDKILISQLPEEEGSADTDEPIEFEYFGIFDGHAGSGAALLASNFLQDYLQEELCKVKSLLFADRPICTCLGPTIIKHDDLIIGALEQAYARTDEKIKQLRANGGCTALVVLKFNNTVYVANAGDSRAVLIRGDGSPPEALSFDHTPDSERNRLEEIAALKPHLLHGVFTADLWQKRPSARDVGSWFLCKPAGKKGWIKKKVDEEDLKSPLIFGSGKKARLLATIGVTRGLGDHFLQVQSTDIYIKPFLSSKPEIRKIELEKDDMIVMATDGLWDVVSNQSAADKIRNVLKQHEETDGRRYNALALELVMQAQNADVSPTGQLSLDDISVFVVPMNSAM